MSALSLRKISRKEYEAKYGVPPENFDDPLPDIGPLPRASDSLASIGDEDSRILDSMIERHGLARVMKALRELCESRAPSDYDCGSTFADVAGGEEWIEYARLIENTIASLK